MSFEVRLTFVELIMIDLTAYNVYYVIIDRFIVSHCTADTMPLLSPVLAATLLHLDSY